MGGSCPKSNLRNLDTEEPGGPVEAEEKLWEEFCPKSRKNLELVDQSLVQ